MNLDGVEVGLATAADEADLLKLIGLVQPHVPWGPEHLRWQYFGLPAGAARLHVVRDQNAIVALYAAVPQRFAVGGHARVAWMVQDVMTHPDCRGRGFLHHLGAVCLADIVMGGGIGYTFPNELSERSFRRTGWTELCEVPCRGRSVDAVPAAHDRLRIEPLNRPFDDTATGIWTSAGLEVGVRRDAGYLNWRYAKPKNRYHRFMVEGDRGLLVLKLYRRDRGSVLHICELLVGAAHRALIPGMLAFCLEIARREGAEEITAWLPRSHPYASFFDDQGVVLERAQRRFVFVVAPRELGRTILDPSAWHLTLGDSDVY